MSPTPMINVSLLIKGRCNVTGQIYEFVADHPMPADERKNVIPPGGQLTNCPTGDGTATTVGQMFYIENGTVTDSVNLDELWHIHFTGCLINEQEYGTDTEYMSSTVYFQATPANQQEGIEPLSLSCSVRQPYSDDLPFVDVPLEVSRPVALQNRLDFEDFSKTVERYYRYLIGPTGNAVRIGKLVRDMVMKNIKIHTTGDDLVKVMSNL